MYKTFKTGIPLLDKYLGGGIPRGTVALYGEDNSGATSLSLSIAREAALMGATTAFIALKGGTSPQYIRRHCGASCAFSSPRFGAEAFEQSAALLIGGVSVLILDSLDAAVPLADTVDMIGEREPLGQNRLLLLGMRTLRDLAMQTGALVVTTSEMRTQLPTRKLVPTYRTVLGDCANTRILLKKSGFISEYGTVLYRRGKARIEQSMLTPPGGEVEFKLWDTRGIDRGSELLGALIATGVLVGGKSHIMDNGKSIGHGFNKARDTVSNNYQEYYSRLMEMK